MDIDKKYSNWYSEIEAAARKTIGKTTIRDGKKSYASSTSKALILEKKAIKEKIQQEKNPNIKELYIAQYKDIQRKARNEIVRTRTEYIMQKYEEIINDGSQRALWREKKSLTRNPVLECLTIKDLRGNRHFQPEDVKEHTAQYYETLYKYKEYEPHQYHIEVETKTMEHMLNNNYDNEYYNLVPTIQEIAEIIHEKKNNKSTTDIKNEMLKRPGETMAHFIYPLISTIWKEEKIPKIWNKGHITSLWKGRGDKEQLLNHRGITTSSAIGTIIEAAIDKRIERTVKFTQAQGGGKRKASTFDHLFILRAMVDISKKEKRETFLTFYDVSKAYDNANNDVMLSIIWDHGLKGKCWRILHKFSSDLTAIVKTR